MAALRLGAHHPPGASPSKLVRNFAMIFWLWVKELPKALTCPAAPRKWRLQYRYICTCMSGWGGETRNS
eukprot:4196250-Prymnesium_polylepis.1